LQSISTQPGASLAVTEASPSPCSLAIEYQKFNDFTLIIKTKETNLTIDQGIKLWNFKIIIPISGQE
jgi:hypothetical protein